MLDSLFFLKSLDCSFLIVKNFQQDNLTPEEVKDTSGAKNFIALPSEEKRVEDSTEKVNKQDLTRN